MGENQNIICEQVRTTIEHVSAFMYAAKYGRKIK